MRPFLDTNILVYAHSDDPRGTVARELVGTAFQTSAQAIGEFVNIARKKLGRDWPWIEEAVFGMTDNALIHPLTLDTELAAMKLARVYGFHIYDALMVAVALAAGADELLSEDMDDGLVVNGRLTIRNPFVADQ